VLHVLWCWITGEPLQWRGGEPSPQDEAPDVVTLLHQGEEHGFAEARDVASRRESADLFSGDTRYGGLQALEERMEPSGRATV
jgi:hypothetical protein